MSSPKSPSGTPTDKDVQALLGVIVLFALIDAAEVRNI